MICTNELEGMEGSLAVEGFSERDSFGFGLILETIDKRIEAGDRDEYVIGLK